MVRNKHNTLGIIKYTFWQMTYENPKSAYACINPGLEHCPFEIESQSVCINDDIRKVIHVLLTQ